MTDISEGSKQKLIVALKHQESQRSTCPGQAFVIICLFCESHLNLEEILIVACQEGVLTLSEDLFYLCSSGTCLASTVVVFLAFALHFKSLLFVLTNTVVILPKRCDHVESINYCLLS